jgi:uncharacterized protein
MGRPVVHWELWSENPDRISTFYQRVFDWDIRHIPQMNYHMVQTGGTGSINGGIMKPLKGPWPGKLAFYIDVDDLDAHTEKIKQADGKIVVDKMDGLFRWPPLRVEINGRAKPGKRHRATGAEGKPKRVVKR